MNVKMIVETWLREHKFDGLCSPDAECGCLCGDLAPCGEIQERCRPGHREDVDEHAECGCDGQGTKHWHVRCEAPLTALYKACGESTLWKCECGEQCNPSSSAWRWNGCGWEHHHGYPIGHVPATRSPKPDETEGDASGNEKDQVIVHRRSVFPTCSGCGEQSTRETYYGWRMRVIGLEAGGWVPETRPDALQGTGRLIRIRPPIMEYLCPACAEGIFVRPGSSEARKKGCTCPEEPNRNKPAYTGYPDCWDVFTLDSKCPIHYQLRSWRDCPEKGTPMLCFAHGGSEGCEQQNREQDTRCPKCSGGGNPGEKEQ